MLSFYNLRICCVLIVRPGRHKKGEQGEEAEGDKREKREAHLVQETIFALCPTNFLWSDYT